MRVLYAFFQSGLTDMTDMHGYQVSRLHYVTPELSGFHGQYYTIIS